MLRGRVLFEGWEDVEGIFQHGGLLYIIEIICFKDMSCYYNNLLVGHYGIYKTKKLISERLQCLLDFKDSIL